MPVRAMRLLPVLCLVIACAAAFGPARAQTPEPNAADKAKQQTVDPKKDNQKRDDLMEVSKQVNGPAGNPECIWLGRRVVNLLWRDDLDTAFRHLDLYDRFGCPGGHIQATFRCVVRQGTIDPKMPESLSGRVQACWINPAEPPAPAAAATAPAAPAGTTTQ